MKKLAIMTQNKGNIGLIFLAVMALVIVIITLIPADTTPLVNAEDYCHQFADHEEFMTSNNGTKYKLIKDHVPVLDYWINDGKYNHYGSTETLTDHPNGEHYAIRYPQWGSSNSYQFGSDVDPSQPFSLNYGEYGIVFRFKLDQSDEPIKPNIQVPIFYGAMEGIIFMDIFQQVGAKPLPDYVLKCQDYPKNLDLETMMLPGQNISINVAFPGITVIHPKPDEPGAAVMRFNGGGQVSKVDDLKSIGVPPESIKIPDQIESSDEAQLQAEWFLLQQQKFLIHNWWTPHCKPAVYLYPPQKMLVNVKVKPAGHLIYTDPLYPENGWNVEANPDGQIINLGANNFMKQYDYLYFESRVPDAIIKKPTKGWVVASELANQPASPTQRGERIGQPVTQIPSPLVGEGQGEGYAWFNPLEAKFNDILPKLGLNEVQTKDFIRYWKKALPYSPYYFIGVINQQNVDEIEQLEITPKPDSVNRVRIYFERLDEPKTVKTPVLDSRPLRLDSSKFNVVEWGGMVKMDPNHPFTCSQ